MEVITLSKKEGVRAKGKFRRQLTSGVLLTFLRSDIFLSQSSLGKSLIYCVRT